MPKHQCVAKPCQHKQVKFCALCQKCYCVACGAEWVTQAWTYTHGPNTAPFLQPNTTICLPTVWTAPNGDPPTQTTTTTWAQAQPTCSHVE